MSNKGNRMARKNEVEKRIDHIEKYLDTFRDKVGQVAEDVDNIRFLVSLIRRQEMNAMMAKQHIERQNSILSMTQEFMDKNKLKDQFEEFAKEKNKPEPDPDPAPPEDGE